MFGKKIVLHSDLFAPIPSNIFYPLARYGGFSNFDFTEKYILNLIRQAGKEFDLKKFSGFSNRNTNKNDLLNIVSLLNSKFYGGLSSEENGTISDFKVNSIHSNPNYSLDNDIFFEKELRTKWVNLFDLLYRLEGDCLVINIPAMDISSQSIEQEPLYYQKFLNKLSDRIISISEIAAKQDILLLLNHNPLDNSHIVNERFTFNDPFLSFFDFRKFYDSLLQKTNYFGLFLDISSYFASDYASIQNFLHDIPKDEKDLSSPKFTDKFLLRNPKIGEIFFENLKKIENLKGLGLNDIKLMGSLTQSEYNIKISEFQNTSKNILKSKLSSSEDFAISSLKEKRIIGDGDLPMRSFLYYLKYLNPSSQIPDFYSINSPLKSEGFNFDVIDWRGINLEKLKIPNIMSSSIKLFLHDKELINKDKMKKEGISRWKKTERTVESEMGENNYDRDFLDPPNEKISKMQIFSLRKIHDSLKQFYSFL